MSAQSPEGSQPPDGLDLDLTYRVRTGVMALRLAGELDLASTPRFRRALDWIRRRHDQAIILDTSGLTFVDLTGYRALDAALALPDGRRDPRVLYVVGTKVARLGALLDSLRPALPALSPTSQAQGPSPRPGRRHRAGAPRRRRGTSPRSR